MFKLTARELAEKTCFFRYAYFIVTSLKPTSFKSWRKQGEPNPFVEKTYPVKESEIVDFIDIFYEYRSDRSRSTRNNIG